MSVHEDGFEGGVLFSWNGWYSFEMIIKSMIFRWRHRFHKQDSSKLDMIFGVESSKGMLENGLEVSPGAKLRGQGFKDL